MLKRILTVLLLLSALLLSSCAMAAEEKEEDGALPASAPIFEMEAVVLELGEKITVDVTKSEYTSGVHLVIPSENVAVSDAKGNALSLSDIGVGDKLRIVYNGQVMLSYPPQIVATAIILLS